MALDGAALDMLLAGPNKKPVNAPQVNDTQSFRLFFLYLLLCIFRLFSFSLARQFTGWCEVAFTVYDFALLFGQDSFFCRPQSFLPFGWWWHRGTPGQET